MQASATWSNAHLRGTTGGRLCLSGQACHVPTESLLLREHVKSDCCEAGLGMWNCHSKFWVTISFEWCFHEQGNEYVSCLRCGLQTFSFAIAMEQWGSCYYTTEVLGCLCLDLHDPSDVRCRLVVSTRQP